MFHSQAINELAQTHQSLFKDLAYCQTNLNQRFVDLDDAILALVLAMAAKAPLIFVGPPGTAKSKLIRSFCALLGLVDLEDLAKGHTDYFEYLLTPFTEPAELFGYYDLAKAAGDTPELVRKDCNSMQKARVIYLDEVFNGSSAILNTMLAIMNEGVFHDHDKRSKTEIELLSGATNQVPERPELRAFYDRFVLRCFVDNMEPTLEKMTEMLDKGMKETYRQHNYRQIDSTQFFKKLALFQKDTARIAASGLLLTKDQPHWVAKLTSLVRAVEDHGLPKVSNRRLLQMTRIMMIHAVYRVATSGSSHQEPFTTEELMLFPRFFLDRPDSEIAAEMERHIEDNR